MQLQTSEMKLFCFILYSLHAIYVTPVPHVFLQRVTYAIHTVACMGYTMRWLLIYIYNSCHSISDMITITTSILHTKYHKYVSKASVISRSASTSFPGGSKTSSQSCTELPRIYVYDL